MRDSILGASWPRFCAIISHRTQPIRYGRERLKPCVSRHPFALTSHSLGLNRRIAEADQSDFARRANHFVFSEMACPAPFAKIFCFAPEANQFTDLHRPVPQRGGSRSSRTRGGMRWTRQRARRTRPAAYGEVVWF